MVACSPACKAITLVGTCVIPAPHGFGRFSHLVSDLFGIGQGFRDSNAWLAILTNHSFSPGFYAGDAWGSFNSLMRLLTGILFGMGIVWFGFPYLDAAFSPTAGNLESGPDSTQVKKVKLDQAHHQGANVLTETPACPPDDGFVRN